MDKYKSVDRTVVLWRTTNPARLAAIEARHRGYPVHEAPVDKVALGVRWPGVRVAATE